MFSEQEISVSHMIVAEVLDTMSRLIDMSDKTTNVVSVVRLLKGFIDGLSNYLDQNPS